MGIQDRDYYRDWWRKREGYVEKAEFRLPVVPSKRLSSIPPFVCWLGRIVVCVGWVTAILWCVLRYR